MLCVVKLQTTKSKYFVYDSLLLWVTQFPTGLEEVLRIISLSFSLWNPFLHPDDMFDIAVSEATLFIPQRTLQPEGESLTQYLEN